MAKIRHLSTAALMLTALFGAPGQARAESLLSSILYENPVRWSQPLGASAQDTLASIAKFAHQDADTLLPTELYEKLTTEGPTWKSLGALQKMVDQTFRELKTLERRMDSSWGSIPKGDFAKNDALHSRLDVLSCLLKWADRAAVSQGPSWAALRARSSFSLYSGPTFVSRRFVSGAIAARIQGERPALKRR
ncbi:MAG: hypothetical protein H6707_12380 [Deltaproteobacteria bacterium]|nr:hypothetical protein [Deltaproteobacteria bacterium]